MEFLTNPSSYVYLAFLIVMVLLVVKGKNAVLGASYARIQRISNDIAMAEKVRMEAKEKRNEQEKKFNEAIEYSKNLVQQARQESEYITQQAQQKANDIIAHAEQHAQNTIKRAEHDARIALQNQAVDKAFDIVKQIATETADDTLLQTAIGDIKRFK